ncbi:MAG: mRNA surveillance protein pelota [Candidatus Nanoarchaeia archaeon]|nr:mRNA surveillance protein pelota [Candidatus Nanoarchaeia archaeon]
MIILKQNAKTGEVKVRVSSYDDLWHLYHVISKGDIISGKTTRRIKFGDKSEKKTVFLKIEVEKAELHESSSTLRALGRIIEGPEEVSRTHHSFEIDSGTIVEIKKDKWKKYEIDRIKEAVKSSSRAKLLICVFEIGKANFGVLRDYGVQMLGDYTLTIPGKRKEVMNEYQKSKEQFIKELGKNLISLADVHNVKKILLGANQFDLDNFTEIHGKNNNLINMLIPVQISTIDITGINELIRNKKVEKIIEENRIARETKKVEQFIEELAKNGLIIYGFDEVKQATELGAVRELLVTDKLIQEKKSEVEPIIESVEIQKGQIVIISTSHDAGKKLHGFGGIAGFLRYRIS